MGKYLRNSKTNMNIPIRMAAVLLCLTLLSTYMVTGLLARYATSAQGSDHARVARFSIRANGQLMQSVEAKIIPGTPEAVPLIIENNSEVAVEYTVTVTNETKNLPLSFRWEQAEDAPAMVMAEDGMTFTAQQLPGGHSDQYTLYIEWPADRNDPALMGMVDHITVTVTAAQID